MFRILFVCAAMLAGPATADVFTFETHSENIQCVIGLGTDCSAPNGVLRPLR